MTRSRGADYSPEQMDQGVNHEKVFNHKKETCEATAWPGESFEKTLPVAGEPQPVNQSLPCSLGVRNCTGGPTLRGTTING